MGITILKFGGSSLANKANLLKVCNHIINEYNKNNKVVVVASAQGKMTDKLIAEEEELVTNADKREHDVLVSIGEQISISKLAILLKDIGYNAISFTGWQIPIITDDIYGSANILDINTKKILNELNKNKIVIVAGFQGITKSGDITTLGRGGSDTTAVALASYLNAEKLYIYTDVDGIYSSNPKVDKNAIKFNSLSFDKMLEIIDNGSKILHRKCVEIAKKNNISIIVKSTFADCTGSIVGR